MTTIYLRPDSMEKGKILDSIDIPEYAHYCVDIEGSTSDFENIDGFITTTDFKDQINWAIKTYKKDNRKFMQKSLSFYKNVVLPKLKTWPKEGKISNSFV